MDQRTHDRSFVRRTFIAAAASLPLLGMAFPTTAAEPTNAAAAAAAVDPATQPVYTVPYRIPKVAEITTTLQHVRDRLDAWAPVPGEKQDVNPGRAERRQGIIGYP